MHPWNIATLSRFKVDDLKIVSISHALLVFRFLQGLGGFFQLAGISPFLKQMLTLRDPHPVSREATTAVIVKSDREIKIMKNTIIFKPENQLVKDQFLSGKTELFLSPVSDRLEMWKAFGHGVKMAEPPSLGIHRYKCAQVKHCSTQI